MCAGENQGKKGKKWNNEPRFSFMTKSEMDQLDGYHWHKYDKKEVENISFPELIFLLNFLQHIFQSYIKLMLLNM